MGTLLESHSNGERILCDDRTKRCGRSTYQQTGEITLRILTIAALAALSLNSYAVEYTPVTDVPFDVIHMHDTTTWEKVCESIDGVCDVPNGTYQVKLLDRN